MKLGSMLLLRLFLDRRLSSGSLWYFLVQVIVPSSVCFAVVFLHQYRVTTVIFYDTFKFLLDLLSLGLSLSLLILCGR